MVTRPKKSVAGDSLRASRRARQLIERLFVEMQQGLQDPSYCTSESWDLLFGSKQSMVTNLQKLVAALVALPDEAGAVSDAGKASDTLQFSEADMALLRAWIEDNG